MGLVLLCAALSACEQRRPAPEAEPQNAPAASRRLIPQDAPRDGPVRLADLAPLPEDEAAGKRSQAEWREHLDYEERERQMWFDQPRMAQHRALAKQLAQARATYEGVRSERALSAAQRGMQRKLLELRGRVTQLDPGGVSSRLLPDYAELLTSLESAYPEAKLNALRGDDAALVAARGRFEAQLEHMEEWLEELEHEPEGEHD
jgi:hypothetical protein